MGVVSFRGGGAAGGPKAGRQGGLSPTLPDLGPPRARRPLATLTSGARAERRQLKKHRQAHVWTIDVHPSPLFATLKKNAFSVFAS